MIRTYSEMISSGPWGADTFFGQVDDSPNLYWLSALPDLEAFAANIQADPSVAFHGLSKEQLDRFLRDAVEPDAFSAAWLQISNLGMANLVKSTRNVVGLLVRSCGMLSTVFPKLRGMYIEETAQAMKVVNLLDAMVSSTAFTLAIDIIGAIPVVGWIIKAVVEVAKVIVRVVGYVREKKLNEAYRDIAKRLGVPSRATNLDTNVDQQAMRDLFGYLMLGETSLGPQGIICPAYDGDMEAFAASGVHPKESKRGDVELAAGWVVIPGNPIPGGFGFVPGSGNLTRTMFFPAGVSGGGCGAGGMRDLGSLYPTAQGAANTWWSVVLQQGPPMFQVEPLIERNRWENLIYSLLVLVEDTLKGWTCGPSSIPFSNRFDCVKEVYGVGKCGKAGHKSGRESYPADFGLDPHTTTASYFYKLFFNLGKLTDRFKNYDPDIGIGLPLISDDTYTSQKYGDQEIKWPIADAFDLDQSVPVRALDNLYDRQVATVQSIHCMYVDGESENRDRFPAFNNKALRDQWYESVTAIINGQDWRKVKLVDVPESRMKEHLRQRIRNAGLDPETFNPPCPPGAPPSHPGCAITQLAPAPTVLGDPAPPPPPPSADAEPAMPPVGPMVARPVKKPRKAAAGAGALIVLGAAAAFLATRK